MNKLLSYSFALLFILAVNAAADVNDTRHIRIGGIYDLSTSGGSIWGTTERDAFLLAVEDFQKSHSKVKVESFIEDSQYSNVKSVSAIHKLISTDKVEAIIGPTWEPFVATMPICEQKKVPCFAPSNHGEYFHDPNKALRYSFSAFFREKDYGTVLGVEMRKHHVKKYAVFAAESPYFDTIASGLAETADNVPTVTQSFSTTLQDFRSLITAVPKDIEAIVLLVDTNGQHATFLSQWAAQRRERPIIFAADGVLFEPRGDEIRKLGFQIKASRPYLDPTLEAKWSLKFRNRYGKDPAAPSGSIAYDETMIALFCLAASPQSNSERVRSCISDTENYAGQFGPITFKGAQTSSASSFEVIDFK